MQPILAARVVCALADIGLEASDTHARHPHHLAMHHAVCCSYASASHELCNASSGSSTAVATHCQLPAVPVVAKALASAECFLWWFLAQDHTFYAALLNRLEPAIPFLSFDVLGGLLRACAKVLVAQISVCPEQL